MRRGVDSVSCAGCGKVAQNRQIIEKDAIDSVQYLSHLNPDNNYNVYRWYTSMIFLDFVMIFSCFMWWLSILRYACIRDKAL